LYTLLPVFRFHEYIIAAFNISDADISGFPSSLIYWFSSYCDYFADRDYWLSLSLLYWYLYWFSLSIHYAIADGYNTRWPWLSLRSAFADCHSLWYTLYFGHWYFSAFRHCIFSVIFFHYWHFYIYFFHCLYFLSHWESHCITVIARLLPPSLIALHLHWLWCQRWSHDSHMYFRHYVMISCFQRDCHKMPSAEPPVIAAIKEIYALLILWHCQIFHALSLVIRYCFIAFLFDIIVIAYAIVLYRYAISCWYLLIDEDAYCRWCHWWLLMLSSFFCWLRHYFFSFFRFFSDTLRHWLLFYSLRCHFLPYWLIYITIFATFSLLIIYDILLLAIRCLYWYCRFRHCHYFDYHDFLLLSAFDYAALHAAIDFRQALAFIRIILLFSYAALFTLSIRRHAAYAMRNTCWCHDIDDYSCLWLFRYAISSSFVRCSHYVTLHYWDWCFLFRLFHYFSHWLRQPPLILFTFTILLLRHILLLSLLHCHAASYWYYFAWCLNITGFHCIIFIFLFSLQPLFASFDAFFSFYSSSFITFYIIYFRRLLISLFSLLMMYFHYAYYAYCFSMLTCLFLRHIFADLLI